MTTNTGTEQKTVDALLKLLEQNELGRPVRRPRFQGGDGADFYMGNTANNVANGRRGADLLKGNDGNDRLNGNNGNDVLFGNAGADLLNGGNNQDTLLGDLGSDQLDGGNGNDFVSGGADDDVLLGNSGNDHLVGGDGVDTITGGTGRDRFIYNTNPFANGTPTLAAQPNINVLNRPDIITDYTIGQDRFVFDRSALNINNLVFQKGQAAQIAADGNVIVLTDAFTAAGAAARAIANNNNITANEGVFVYFNSTLGVTRAIYSEDLGDGGRISALANLDNQRGATGLANVANFTVADFSLG